MQQVATRQPRHYQAGEVMTREASSSRETRETVGLQVIGEGRTLEMGTPFYVVPSRTEEGRLYLVYRLKTRLECTCLAGKYHPETPCVHRQAVRDFLLDRMAGNDSGNRSDHPGDTAPLRRDNRPIRDRFMK